MKIILRCLTALFVIFSFSACASLSAGKNPFLLRPDIEGARQVIEVSPFKRSKFRAELTAWELDKGIWRRVFGPWPAVIGWNGFAQEGEKREGDGKTPSGVYRLGMAFGRAKALKTGLRYRQATVSDSWIDDVASPNYNRWVEWIPSDGVSYEKMLRADGLYDAGAVIEYNTDTVVPGQGSAIFMHIWREGGSKPTAGCVALREERLRRLLAWLRVDMKPMVLLGGR